MGWTGVFRKKYGARVAAAGDDTVIDVTTEQTRFLDVTMSIHAGPEASGRFGAALCMLSDPGRAETTGSVVQIGRRPHSITKEQFQSLLREAGETGHLDDGFLEIEATVDLTEGEVVWQPEDGEGVSLPHLDEVVENTIASLVETNAFGEWFSPTRVVRSATTR